MLLLSVIMLTALACGGLGQWMLMSLQQDIYRATRRPGTSMDSGLDHQDKHQVNQSWWRLMTIKTDPSWKPGIRRRLLFFRALSVTSAMLLIVAVAMDRLGYAGT
ncbi:MULTISPECIES: hypothetical protein [unclassified Brevundimonas]|uniref:hypothetical protein n=1 Tax=unclassified Brevundimonas TaxID=2622653 RepID=UPI0025C4F91D|nr:MULTISPECIES: hypothetical protein [unclassified Brevundimonas]